MRIQTNYDIAVNSLSKQKFKQSKSQNQLSFKSIFADAKPCNIRDYMAYWQLCNILGDKKYSTIKKSSTRIFREHVSQLALAKYLNPDEKTQIKVLGCSDGSEAYAYAIAMKDKMGNRASENIKVLGVDNQAYAIELAKTGKIVCSDTEKVYANDLSKGETPLTGEGWKKYLQQTSRPDNFSELLEKYPMLVYVENDPVAKKSVGDGFNWYKINRENLPDIKFEQGDLFDYLNSTDGVKNEVYVIANTAGYILEKCADDYINIFENIKRANQGKNKNVYVVIGDLEFFQLNPNMRTAVSLEDKLKVRKAIKDLSFVNLPEQELEKLNITLPKEASNKIYKLC